jgi:hypothetical protein
LVYLPAVLFCKINCIDDADTVIAPIKLLDSSFHCSDIAKLFTFGNAVRGEDLDWTIRLAQSRNLQTEYTSDPSRIHYIYNLGNRSVAPETAEMQRHTNYQSMLKMVWLDGGATLQTNESGNRSSGLRLSARGFVSK